MTISVWLFSRVLSQAHVTIWFLTPQRGCPARSWVQPLFQLKLFNMKAVRATICQNPSFSSCHFTLLRDPNERSIILRDIRELSAGVKQRNQLSHQLLFCTLLREKRRKRDEVEPVLCQCTETWWHHGVWGMCECSSQRCNSRAGGHSQPGFKMINIGSIILTIWCRLTAQMLPRGPSMCKLWGLCTSLLLVPELANF